MAELKILHYPEPVLFNVGKPVENEEINLDFRSIVDEMFRLMYDAGGVGLAAPQVGISKRFFIMDVPNEDGSPNPLVFINPEIIAVEGEQTGDEGCLSFPGLYQVVRREMRVIARAQNLEGEQFEADFTSLAARCVLHETDHCDGIVFLDRMSPLKREIAKRKIRKLRLSGEWD